MIIQWGQSANPTNVTSQTVTFPIEFPNTKYPRMVATHITAANTASSEFMVGIKLVSKSQFIMVIPKVAANMGTYWVAIGW